MGIPDDARQLVILLVFVVPGVVYQTLRTRFRGPTPDELDATRKVLRAVAASGVLALVYLLVFGRTLVDAARGRGFLLDHPRVGALAGLALLFAVPAALAIAEQARVVRRATGAWPRPGEPLATYDPTPTGWDYAFRAFGSGWVRVLTTDGQWIGGWWGDQSFATSFPQPRELFLETQWAMSPAGEFLEEMEGTRGVYVRCDDIRAIGFVGVSRDRAWGTVHTLGVR